MDCRRSVGIKSPSKARLRNILKLINRFLRHTPTDRVLLAKKLSLEGFKFICEILKNVLNKTVELGQVTIDKLQSVKNEIRTLTSKTVSMFAKKNFLNSIKGYFILNEIFPHAQKYISDILNEGVRITSE